MKEGGTSLHGTIREINLVFKGRYYVDGVLEKMGSAQ